VNEPIFVPESSVFAQRQRRSRLILLLLVAIFALPLGVATLLYYHPQLWTPTSFTNHNKLLQPIHSFNTFDWQEESGETFGLDRLLGHWTLLHLGHGDCLDACQTVLDNTRQVRLSLGHNINRLQRLYLEMTPLPADRKAMLEKEHSRMVWLQGEADDLQQLQNLLGAEVTDPARLHVYLVDPLGNVILRYTPALTGSDLLKDLRKLLRNSRIG